MNEIDTEDKPTDWEPHEQRWRVCNGYMEREEGRLQLRVDLQLGESVCNVLFEEDDESVSILILVCGERRPDGDWCNCPTHIYLDKPLGDREVVDMLRGGLPVPYVNVWEEMEKDGILERNPDGNGFRVNPEWYADNGPDGNLDQAS